MKKCVITGLGSICAIGKNLNEVWKNAVDGVCGIKELDSIDTSTCYTKIAGEVKNFEPTFPKARQYSKRMDKVSLLCIEAVNEAVSNAKLDIGAIDKERLSVVIGSCFGGAVSGEQVQRQLLSTGKIHPREILKSPVNVIAGNVSFFLGAHGVVANVGNACAAGTISIAYACDLIRFGLADVVIAGGAETVSPVGFTGFIALKALDTIPCSPFSRSQGLTLGEGAGAVVVESLEHAQKRNAPILCEVLGYGVTSDAYHITAPNPEGEGQMAAIRLAMEEAGIGPADVDYLNAHGTGTPLNDRAEGISLGEIFKNETATLKISSSKSMIGHCLGAAGALEAVLSIKALENAIIPPTVNFVEKPEEDTSEKTFDFVPNKAQEVKLNTVMSNSFAFGGNNASIIFSKDTERKSSRKNNNDRVYITGLGIVNSLGGNAEDYWQNIIKGNTGIVDVSYKDKKYRSNCAAPAVVDFTKYGLSPSELRKLDRLSKLLLASGTLAIKNANIEVNPDIEKDIGVIVGTSDGPVSDTVALQDGFIKKGYHAASALIFPNTVYNAAGGYLSINTKSKGNTVTLVNGVQAGINSVCYGFDLVRTKKQKYVVASGVDEYTENTHVFYDSLRALAKENVAPYSFKEQGFTLGEGSTSIILESLEDANKRGAFRYAEIVGYGLTNTPVETGKIDVEGVGLDRAIHIALKSAGVKITEIDAIVGFANGCKDIDTMELNSYKRVFGELLKDVPVHSIKALTGEGRAATSALQVAHGALMLSKQEAPGTRGNDSYKVMLNGEEVCLTETTSKPYKNILITSFSFGGAYSAMVLRRVE